MNMSPWWKRPTSESASAAAQKQSEEKGRSSARSKQSDGDDSNEGPRRRRRGRRGGNRGGGRSSGGRNNSGGQPKNRSRRPKRSGGRRKPSAGGEPVLLVEVEALHKHLKIEGDGPADTAKLFAQVGSGVKRRAVACGMRKQKVQRALKELGFDIERVDGGVEDARLRLALDALELALDQKGAQIWLLTQVGGIDLLGDRLRHHGAAVSTFSLSDLPVIGDADGGGANTEDEADDSEDDQDRGGDASDQADEGAGERKRPRRRRRRRRGGERDDEGQDSSASAPEDSRAKSESDPFELLRAAVGKLAEGEGEVVWASKVRQHMFELDPVFNELEHGYRDFDALLREAERRGHVSLQKDPRTSTFIVVAWRAA